MKQVGRELGVRYVLEGSVRKAGQRVRITAQLIDAQSGSHLWADRFDGSLEDVFDLQDKVAIGAAGIIEPTLRQAEIERARRKRADSLDAYDLYLRALPFALHLDAGRCRQGARVCRAGDKAGTRFCRRPFDHRLVSRAALHEAARAAALHHARLAISTGGDDATALAIAGLVIGFLDPLDYTTALDAFGRSLALSPSSALALGFSSVTRAWRGDSAIAIQQAEQALRLSPFDPLSNIRHMAIAIAHFGRAALRNRLRQRTAQHKHIRGSARLIGCARLRWPTSAASTRPN